MLFVLTVPYSFQSRDTHAHWATLPRHWQHILANAQHARQWLHKQSQCWCRVGMLFLPKDEKLANLAKQIVEDVVKKEGHCHIVGWRDVPVVHEVVGRMARDAEPRIVQVWHCHALSSSIITILPLPVPSCFSLTMDAGLWGQHLWH